MKSANLLYLPKNMMVYLHKISCKSEPWKPKRNQTLDGVQHIILKIWKNLQCALGLQQRAVWEHIIITHIQCTEEQLKRESDFPPQNLLYVLRRPRLVRRGRQQQPPSITSQLTLRIKLYIPSTLNKPYLLASTMDSQCLKLQI